MKTSELPANQLPDFRNTQIAFAHLSDAELKKAVFLFKMFRYKWLVKYGPALANLALNIGIPVKGLIKNTIFSHFCGGESIEESRKTISHLAEKDVYTILDYSVEGEENEAVFEHTCNEIILTIEEAKINKHIPFSVFKPTGVVRFDLLEKLSKNETLNKEEKAEWEKAYVRIVKICSRAFNSGVRVMIDAEESWIQPVIDKVAMEMSEKFNREQIIVYNTIQLYRHDRLDFMKNCLKTAGHPLGFKLVRGAYMEKERERAKEKNYISPIHTDKFSADKDYNAAIDLGFENLDKCALVIGTHNEDSCLHAINKMNVLGIEKRDERVYFSQLLGMSDNISFNLAEKGYLSAKYVPYGPIKSVLPYLSRRAEENSSVKGQTSRELEYINMELKRRKENSKKSN